MDIPLVFLAILFRKCDRFQKGKKLTVLWHADHDFLDQLKVDDT